MNPLNGSFGTRLPTQTRKPEGRVTHLFRWMPRRNIRLQSSPTMPYSRDWRRWQQEKRSLKTKDGGSY